MRTIPQIADLILNNLPISRVEKRRPAMPVNSGFEMNKEIDEMIAGENDESADKVASVFVIAQFIPSGDIMLQKVRKKHCYGIPGGTVENGEDILHIATREFLEETGQYHGGGIDISGYNAKIIGRFKLSWATAGEEGAAVFVQLPETEFEKCVAGQVGADDEEEFIEEIFLVPLTEALEMVERRELTSNSCKVLEIYKEFLLSQHF